MSSEIRALEMMATVPSGCGLFPVMDDRSDPHLRLGEIAVIDLADRAPQHGEVYVVQWSDGRRAITQVWNGRCLFRSTPGQWWTAALTAREAVPGLGTLRMVDGPRSPAALGAALIGRVVGILDSIAIRSTEPRRA